MIFYIVWKGGIVLNRVAKVLKIALPAVGEMLLYMLVWVVDTALVGRYGGDTAVSAVGFSSEVIYTILNVFVAMGIGVGITTMVAQNIGAGDKERAEEYLGQGLTIGIIISVFISFILGVFPREILSLFGAKGEVLNQGMVFMRIVSLGAFFNMFNSMLNSALRGTGNTLIPLVVSIIINVVAIPLDIILINGKFGLKPLGVVGSAIATSTAYLCGFIFLCIYFKYYSDFKIKFKFFKRMNKYYISRIIKLAIPSGLQEGAFSVSRLICISFIMHIGTRAFAANTITTQIESISYMPGWGFAVAASALVGQQIGAKEYDKAREYAKISMLLGVCVMLVCSVLFILVPQWLVGLFINDKETIMLGRDCLMVAAIEQPFMAISMILGGALRGAGDTKTPFKIALVSSWIIRIPLMYIVIYVLNLSVVYVWAVTAIQWGFEGFVMLFMYRKKSMQWSAREV